MKVNNKYIFLLGISLLVLVISCYPHNAIDKKTLSSNKEYNNQSYVNKIISNESKTNLSSSNNLPKEKSNTKVPVSEPEKEVIQKIIPILKIISVSNENSIKNNRISIELKAEKFEIVPRDSPTRENEGHYHVWVDDRKQEVFDNKAIFDDVSSGQHTITAELVKSDHSSLNPQIAQTISVEFNFEPITNFNQKLSRVISTNQIHLYNNFVVVEDDGTLSDKGGPLSVGSFLDIGTVARSLYSSRLKDDYDFIGIFTDFGSGSNGALNVFNDVKGIGYETDQTQNYGSNKKLKTISYLSAAITDVQGNKIYYGSERLPVDSLLATLQHEIGHHWCCYVGKEVGLTEDGGHWQLSAGHPHQIEQETRSLDTDADTLGGIDVIDNADDTVTFVNVAGNSGFSKFHPFTLYLMGFMSKEEVKPILYIQSKDGQSLITRSISEVTKKWISIDDLIQVAGERVPDYSKSQKDFKMALILVTEKGKEPSPEAINLMNHIADKFPDWWSRATDGRSTMSTELS